MIKILLLSLLISPLTMAGRETPASLNLADGSVHVIVDFLGDKFKLSPYRTMFTADMGVQLFALRDFLDSQTPVELGQFLFATKTEEGFIGLLDKNPIGKYRGANGATRLFLMERSAITRMEDDKNQ